MAPRELTPGRLIFLLLLAAGVAPGAASGQATDVPRRDTVAVHVAVTADSAGGEPVEGAVVRSGSSAALTDARGRATLRLATGTHTISAARLGYAAASIIVALRPGADTVLSLVMHEAAAEVERVVVSAARGGRRVEDTPLRVEVIDEEEIAEKVAMTPGDISMMLAETGGLRVQATNPSLGGANVRVQGLRGRYSLILADGLPLHGQAGGLGLLQIPPVDLGAVEIIKGTASALYGSAALGGVINLVARRPAQQPERTALVNQTSRGGTDAVYFGTGAVAPGWKYTLLAGAHRQERRDLDADGWTDMPGYARGVVRPRVYFDGGDGRSAFFTAGATAEDRRGGTLEGRSIPGHGPFAESLRTRRADVGGLARWVRGAGAGAEPGEGTGGSIVTVRGSAMEQRHRHEIGGALERDRHRTWFGEATLAIPRTHGGRNVTYVAGAAYQQDVYRGTDIPAFDYTHRVPAVFAQVDADAASWLSVSASARADAHSAYGTFLSPRVSALLRAPGNGAFAGWTTRLSGGAGAFAPTPFTEETEATGLTPLAPLAGLVAERAQGASIDIGGPLRASLGAVELNATAFASRITHPLQVRRADGFTGDGARRIELVNAPDATRTWGGELLARVARELGEGGEEAPALRVTASYTYLRATECDLTGTAGAPADCARREVPLTPRHAAGIVAAVEQEGRSRIGVELYHTGRQALADNPFRSESRPYLLVGLLGERVVATRLGAARLFLNLENLTNVRQTRFDPLLLPARGEGGRWTTDAWTDLAGFTANAGMRLAF